MHKQIEFSTISLSDENRLYGVKSNAIDEVWEYVLPFIENSAAFSDGKYSASDIYENIRNQYMQLWVVFNIKGDVCAAVVTQIISYPQQKRLCIMFCGGLDIHKWLHLIDLIFDFGRAKGCSSIEIYGRPGWEKILKDYGFKKIHTVVKVDL